MKTKKPRFKHPVRSVLLTFLAYVLVMNIVPFMGDRQVCTEMQQQFAQTGYYGSDEDGPDRIALLETPQDALNARLAVIGAAEHSLDIVYHSILAGESTDAFFAEVLRAADRGVTVRLLLDAKGGTIKHETKNTVKALGNHPNIIWFNYVPINLLKPWEFQVFLHDKYIIADGQLLIMGGRNLGDRFFAPSSYDAPITYDRDVLVWRAGEGASVMDEMGAYFDSFWYGKYTKVARTTMGDTKVQTIYDGLEDAAIRFRASNPGFFSLGLDDYLQLTVPTRKITLLHNPIHTWKKEPWAAYQMMQLAMSAQEQVVVQTPYATTNPQMLDWLNDVGQHVPVTLVTNSMASSQNYPAFSNYAYSRNKFMEAGTSLYEYQSSHSIHGKTMLVDDRMSIVGSLNMDDRSLYLDTEIMLAIDSVEFSAILTDAIQDIQQQCLMVDVETNRYHPDPTVTELSVGIGKRLMMFLFSLLSRVFRCWI